MLNRFANGLLRFIGAVMFFGGMASFAYAVIGGYYHYTLWWHAVLWGLAGWILFFVGKDMLDQYKPAEQPVAAQQPVIPPLMPSSPYSGADTNTRNPWPSNPGGGWQPQRRPFDEHWNDD